MLANGCGFATYRDEGKHFWFLNNLLYLECNGGICPLVKSNIVKNSKINFTDNKDSADGTLKIENIEIIKSPIIVGNSKIVNFYRYIYKFNAYIYVNDNAKPFVLKDWKISSTIDTMIVNNNLSAYSELYGYDNLYVYYSESQVNNILLDKSVESLSDQVIPYVAMMKGFKF